MASFLRSGMAAFVTINPILPLPVAGQPFTVSGKFLGGLSGLQYADGNGTLKTLPPNAGSTQTVVAWSFLHPAASAGSLTIKVAYPGLPTYAASVTVNVTTVPEPTHGRNFSNEYDAKFN